MMHRVYFGFTFLLISLPLKINASQYRLETLISKGVEYPVHATMAPRDKNALYIVEQRGVIRVWKGGTLLATNFLNIQQKVRSGGEMGLLSVAFHPQFNLKGSPNKNRVFVNYTTRQQGKNYTIVAEYRPPSKKERILLKIHQPYSNHNGGQLAFGPDGYLYIGMGDGGSAGDPLNAGQDRNRLLGKILRIDINGKSPYQVPPGNPFAKSGGRKEIFAWGLRNPWRFSFDVKTGRLFAADVGQNAWEEIHIIEKGKNYGWRILEGSHCYLPRVGCSRKGLENPIHEYPRKEGVSVTGGYVYWGRLLPELKGAYIFGDYVSGKIWALKENQKSKRWKHQLLMRTTAPISSFAIDGKGELLILGHRSSSQATLFRLVKKAK